VGIDISIIRLGEPLEERQRLMKRKLMIVYAVRSIATLDT